MHLLTKKTTILFSPKVYRQLERVAHKEGTSVADLIRRAAIQRYLLPNRQSRVDAVEALAAMRLPVSDWHTMHGEIAQGAFGHQRKSP